jgi:putative chitinase
MSGELVNNKNTPKYCTKLPTFVLNSMGKKPQTVAKHSHFNDPISIRENMGNSRIWADANENVKLNSINQILDEAIKQKMSLHEAIFALSVAHTESGFNPDAAAGSTSASGLGQFINKTGELYGLNSNNRFNIEDNARALVSLLKNNLKESKNEVNENDIFIQAYSHYHDGTNVSSQTQKFASNKIPSLMDKFTNYIFSKDCLGRDDFNK